MVAPWKQRPDGEKEPAANVGLGNNGARATGAALRLQTGVVMGGHHDHLYFGETVANDWRRRQPTEGRHVNIEQDQGGTEARDHRQRFDAIARDSDDLDDRMQRKKRAERCYPAWGIVHDEGGDRPAAGGGVAFVIR